MKRLVGTGHAERGGLQGAEGHFQTKGNKQDW